ncbi:hypothetical protein OF83DRAFT_681953 [Amylostereum chailletii]|nr:hypothetical protein OF83DRAFT_681953 [Amylostereum chailletii]
MNGDRLEQLVLSGELFNGASRSSSPARSASPDAPWPPGSRSDDDDDEDENGSDVLAEIEGTRAPAESIGMGPGRTGVKGVIRDRDEAAQRAREGRARDARELARRMEKTSLGGMTWAEEERARGWEKEREGWEKGGLGMRRGKGKFGYLREVGVAGFLPAIEQEERSVSVVVHIYESSLDRCDALDDVLVRLARVNPQTKFIRVRASAIGYAVSSPPSSRSRPPPSSSAFLSRAARLLEEDEDDPYGTPEAGEEEYEEDIDDVEVDTDMLPTMHVYRAGELVHNWVRVDWEAGEAGVEDLLERHHVLESQRNAGGGLSVLDDDEGDIRFGKPDGR